jgi:glycerol-3-phosphate dehydrogenase subunit C
MTDLMRDSLDHCVKCTICETFCPVAAATPLFPGPKYVGPQAERFRGTGDSPDHSLDYCSGCGICTQVCPQGVKIAEINTQARAELKARDGVPVRDRLVARSGLLGRLGLPVAPIANRALASPAVRSATERVLKIDRNAPMPSWSGRPLSRKQRKHGAADVAYFAGCSTSWFEPHVGEAALAVLDHNGERAVVPPSRCCGLPLQSNGLFEDARRHVRRLAAQLAPHAKAGRPVVGTSTSCTLMLKREAREILGVEDGDLVAVSECTEDICEHLRRLLHEGKLRTDFEELRLKVAYYAPCQQRGHGMGFPAVELLRLVPGLEVVHVEGSCCGTAGTYGLKREKHAIAMAVGEPLFAAIKAVSPDLVACDSETCRWQIAQATGLKAVHPVEVLARAYGLTRTT